MLLFASVFSFSLQSSDGRDSTGMEWGSLGLRKIFASVLGAA